MPGMEHTAPLCRTDEMPTQRVRSVLAAGTLAKTPVSVHFCSIGLQVIFNFFLFFSLFLNVPGQRDHYNPKTFNS